MNSERDELRKDSIQRLNLDLAPDLPVSEAAEDICRQISEHQVVIVAGETGSGKTTQLPKLCMSLGLGATGMIGHTQPRRLAARTVSQRIAEETGARHGTEVGFCVRFSDAVVPETVVKVMTDGILLTEIRHDRELKNYDAIIIDEAHERSLNIDFLLGYLKRVAAKRPDLKIIITSATIDVERFSKFFADAPIVEVSGRTYPVEVVYQEPPEDLSEGIGDVLEDIDTRPHQGAQDVLVFLSGEREILEVSRNLRRRYNDRFDVLPLYARLSNAEQQKVFQSQGGRRRVVLATNVAETSITVPGIGFVIDPGMVRINRYSYRTKLQRLPIEPISQASANQRKGRCGRVAPGVCFRLYEEADFLGRPEFTDPEIRRVNLASVVLQMLAFRLGDIRRFPFIDPPEPRAVKDALRLLDELGALQEGKLTPAGRAMARIPADPRLARMLVEANAQGAVKELLVIVAGLSVQDPRERPLDKAQAADQTHSEFADSRSDFISWLKLWRWLEEEREANSNNQFRRLLRRKFLSYLRVREWREIHRQLRLICRDLGYKVNAQDANYAAIHESVVAGSLSLIAQHDERGVYKGARNLSLRIFPGSGVEKTPRWIVAAEIAETARVYGRCVAHVEPAWIERQAQHLVKKQYSDPHWSLKRGEVVAKLTVTLYGLRLSDNRLVSFKNEDPDLCRTLFIKEGLIPGALQKIPPFLQHNIALLTELHDLEAKTRRRDLLVSDDEVYAYYDKVLPREICRAKDLHNWLRKNDDAELRFSKQMLLRTTPDGRSESDYPSELRVDDLAFALKYRFAPGERDDGVTIRVPLGMMPGLSGELLEWSVPGFFPLVVEHWLRVLPKAKRKQLAPLPDKVAEVSQFLLDERRYRQGRLLTALRQVVKDWYKLSLDEQDWDRTRIPEHLLMHIEVLDEAGKVVRRGRDLRKLKAGSAAGKERSAPKTLRGIKEIPQTGLADYVVTGEQSSSAMEFPGLVDQGDHVDLEYFSSRTARDRAHRYGLSRLVLLKLGQVTRYFRKELDKHPKLGLHFATLGSAEELKQELLLNVVWFCFLEEGDLPQSQAELEARIESRRPDLATVFSHVTDTLAEIFALRFACKQELDKLTGKGFATSREDAERQLQQIAPKDVLSVHSSGHLLLLPRYLSGLLHRLQNLSGHVVKDQSRIQEIERLERSWEELASAELFDPERHRALGILLQESRLQLFAETLARQKVVDHPLSKTFLGSNWKPSLKRTANEIDQERMRVGLS